MKYLLILYFVFAKSIYLSAQSTNKMDSLSKYSYLLIGIVEAKPFNQKLIVGYATGFLIQYNQNLFLVSAWHVLTGEDMYLNSPFYRPFDYLLLRYTDTNNIIQYARVNRVIGAVIPKGRPLFLINPDLLPHGISLNIFPSPPNLNSLTGIVFTQPKIKIKRKSHIDTLVFIYGFSNFPSGITEFTSAARIKLDTIKPVYYFGKTINSFTMQNWEDSIYYPNKWYFVTTPEGIKGHSGAPTFFKYTMYNKKGKIFNEWIDFGGIQSGGGSKYNCAYIVRKFCLTDRLNPQRRK